METEIPYVAESTWDLANMLRSRANMRSTDFFMNGG